MVANLATLQLYEPQFRVSVHSNNYAFRTITFHPYTQVRKLFWLYHRTLEALAQAQIMAPGKTAVEFEAIINAGMELPLHLSAVYPAHLLNFTRS